jgi:hypothetical protein
MATDPESKPVVVVPLAQQYRNPSVFQGDPGQDPSKWLKEYKRVAEFNKWDDTICLANAYFFLGGTARQWYENNEEILVSWEKFSEELKKTFGDTRRYVQKAQKELEVRAQKPGEGTQSYIQSVLGLCHEVNPNMSEDDKVSHLMKGVAEDIYQALLTKEVKSTQDFIKWCQHIEDMKQKRIGGRKFSRLPNVIPMASLDEEQDIVSLIRQIVREEVQKVVALPMPNPEPEVQTVEDIVREEVEKTLAPLSRQRDWTEVKPKRRSTYAAIARQPRSVVETERKTDIWRTPDNRPVCFHCGRPGHVVRYCRERRAIFDAYRRADREDASQQRMFSRTTANEYRTAARNSSPSPNRGRSPTRRFRSPSPYRRSSVSPSRRNEEN